MTLYEMIRIGTEILAASRSFVHSEKAMLDCLAENHSRLPFGSDNPKSCASSPYRTTIPL